jgi:hypothetical protein
LFESSRRTEALHSRGPPINADQLGCFEASAERLPGAVFEGANTLGAGSLEKVQHRALIHELGLQGILTRCRGLVFGIGTTHLEAINSSVL